MHHTAPQNNGPITAEELLTNEEFSRVRDKRRLEILDIKKNRRVEVGPDITFYFENRATLLWQIQEMLFIEKGGEEQMQDELRAYNPLLPRGNEFVATMMIEIEDMEKRRVTLGQLGHIEGHVNLILGAHAIKAVPTDETERTTEQGKTSAVHFLHFPLSPEQKKEILSATHMRLEISHPRYAFSSEVTENVLGSLKGDLVK